MNRLKHYLILALSVIGLGATPASAATITGGETSVTLAASFLDALPGLGLTVAPTGNASISNVASSTVLTFPITGGSINDSTGAALIEHVGSGIAFSSGSVVFEIADFIIDTDSGVILGLDGSGLGSVPLFALDASGNLTLTSNAALGLSSTFAGAPDLTGLLVGTAVTAPITAAVPEPATWLMLVLGFGIVGGLIRLRRKPALLAA